MISDDLQTFISEFKLADNNDPLVVVYTPEGNVLSFYQSDRTVLSNSISYMYLPFNKRKIMILSRPQAERMLTQLSTILQEIVVNNREFLVVPKKARTEFWSKGDGTVWQYSGPYLKESVKYYSIKNSFVAKFVLRFYNRTTRLLLKYVKTNNNNKDKSASKSSKS